jgi:hypothetical protein
VNRPPILDEENYRPAFDLYLYLGDVKTHLANHKPMDDADEAAWWLIDIIQNAEEL